MLNNLEEKRTRPILCWRCGRIVFENIKTKHSGCLNTKCKGYLWGSKNIDKSLLRQLRR